MSDQGFIGQSFKRDTDVKQTASNNPLEQSTQFASTNNFSILSFSSTVINDNFADRISLSGFSVSDTGSNIGATGETGEPNHAFISDPLNSVWWSWTAPEDGAAVIDTFGSNYDTSLGVYTGSAVDSLTEIASNDDSSSLQSQVSFAATAGTTYQIAVDGFFSRVGEIELNVNLLEPPVNDNFANRIVLTGSSVSDTGTNLTATGEIAEPNHAGISAPLNSVWWSWTAPEDGVATVNTFGSNYDTSLGVYTGSAVDSLTEVASNDDSFSLQSQVQFEVTSGTTYQIAVDGFFSRVGEIELNLNSFPITAGSDKIFGTPEDDIINALAGNDKVFGREGNDQLFGDEGNDQLFGEEGNDFLDGGEGNDLLKGEIGSDNLFGGNGEDKLLGGEGDDFLGGGNGDDLLKGEEGIDDLFGDSGDDQLFGGEGDDFLNGGEGDDLLKGEEGSDQLFGDDGNDFLKGGEDSDLLSGGNGDDQLFGGDGSDAIDGDNGNDFLKGGEDGDGLFGGEGSDTLNGEEGDDFLSGATPSNLGVGEIDRLTGDDGPDTFVVGFNSDIYYDDNAATISESEVSQAIITDFELGEDVIRLSSLGSYELVEVGSSTQIREISDPVPEVIATIRGETGLDLGDASQFLFV